MSTFRSAAGCAVFLCALGLSGHASWAQNAPSLKEIQAQASAQQDQSLAALLDAKDYAAVQKLSSPLTKKGSAVGQLYEGQLALNGWGVKEDRAKGVKLIMQAAAGGLARAQMLAGIALLQDTPGFAKNDELAIKYLQASASVFTESAMLLASAYEKGLGGLPVDRVRAVEIYKSISDPEHAAKLKPRIEELETFVKYETQANELIVKPLEEQEKLFSDLYFTRKDYATVRGVGLVMAEQGSSVAQHYLGMAHWFARGGPKDDALGARYLAKSAAAGDREAQRMAGRGLLYGTDGFVRDEALAVKYLQACFEFNNYCMLDLAVAHEKGVGGLVKDPAKAYAIYKTDRWNSNFAEMAAVKAKLKELAPLPSSGVKPLAAELSTPLGRELEQLIDEGKFAEAFAKASPVAEKNDPDGLFALYQLYRNGRGVAIDKVKADAYLVRAADAGHLSAMAMEGYGLALSGSKLAKGTRFLKTAADGGNIGAMESLRDLYDYGYSDSLPKNMAQARHYALRVHETLQLRTGSASGEYEVKTLREAKAKAAKYTGMDPKADSQAMFVKVMEAAKSIGVKVTDARTEGNSYFGEGALSINAGSIKAGFSAELMILEDRKPKLFLSFSSGDRRVHEPLRKRMVAALEANFGSLRSVFDGNSTMFVQGW